LRNAIIILLTLSTIVCGENSLNNIDNRFAIKLDLTNLVDNTEFSDSLDIKSKTSSLKPMMASLVIPGFGQYLNQSPWWKTAIFVGVEVVGIAGYVTWTNKADDITKEYENWADEHWDMNSWVNGSAILLSDIQRENPSVNDVRIDGSHHITIIVNGKYENMINLSPVGMMQDQIGKSYIKPSRMGKMN